MNDFWSWQVSIPNLALFGVLGYMVWRSMKRDMAAVIAELKAIRTAAPQVIMGEHFIEKHFDEVRQSLREVTVRIENVERHLGMVP